MNKKGESFASPELKKKKKKNRDHIEKIKVKCNILIKKNKK